MEEKTASPSQRDEARAAAQEAPDQRLRPAGGDF